MYKYLVTKAIIPQTFKIHNIFLFLCANVHSAITFTLSSIAKCCTIETHS